MVPSGEVRRISDELLERIVSGTYPSGLRLPSEVDLASEFSCARSTVREALRHLEALGVVRSRRGSGVLVLDFRREGTPALLPRYILSGKFDQPAPILARELLGIRGSLAMQAVRLAARYGKPGGIAEARAILSRAPDLEHDLVAHAFNELEFFRTLIVSSCIWPAVWLANVFWGPMRELHGALAVSVGKIPAGYQARMEQLLQRIEARDEESASAHLAAWLEHVDAILLRELARVLGTSSRPAESVLRNTSSRPLSPKITKPKELKGAPRKKGIVP